jgi:2-dehydro-3-deoxyphosphogluconate aldolase/(4S)-4-hydroxy-2-oxoglutarate aldolase
MKRIGDIVGKTSVIPVLTLAGAPDGVPVARALVTGGLSVIEVTLRTAGALEAVKAIAAEVKGVTVGVGTVLDPAQFEKARKAGAAFVVSPGFTPALGAAAADIGLPYLPGVSTVSEALELRERGFRHLKFFPAEQCGGQDFLRALAAPLPDLLFCPTGGVDLAKAAGYLTLPNVPCVGGSWVVPPDAIAAGDWARIEALASKAAGLGRGVASPPQG